MAVYKLFVKHSWYKCLQVYNKYIILHSLLHHVQIAIYFNTARGEWSVKTMPRLALVQDTYPVVSKCSSTYSNSIIYFSVITLSSSSHTCIWNIYWNDCLICPPVHRVVMHYCFPTLSWPLAAWHWPDGNRSNIHDCIPQLTVPVHI